MSALSQLCPGRAGNGGLRQRRMSAYRPTLAALAVSVTAGLAIFVTAAGSLMEGAMAALPAVKSPPPGWIDLAFADVDAASAHPATHQQTQVAQPQNTQKRDMRKQDAGRKDPCADFVYFFLNKNCSVKRVSAARRDGFAHRAVAARIAPPPAKQDTALNSEPVTFAATSTTAADQAPRAD